jgi:MoaA/NifB/PqqE/SkfB family radical SAM enzyme
MISEQLPDLERSVLHGIGEPLLNRELPAMIRHLKDRGVAVLFNSNGILLNKKRQEELIDSNLDELRISLDAASPEGYKAIRNSDKFDLIVNNLQAFVNRLESKKLSKPRVSLWFLGSKKNITELPELINLAAKIGIGAVYLQRLVYFLDNEGYGVATRRNTLSNPDVALHALIEQSQEQAGQLGIFFGASGLTEPVDSVRGKIDDQSPWKKCIRPWEVIYVTAHGNVLPCCISPFSTADYSSIILGNLFENSVAEVWFGSKFKEFRKRHQTSSPPNCCQGCGISWSL